MLILVITTKLVLFFKQKSLLMEKTGFFPTIFILKNVRRNYVRKELADMRVFFENFLSFLEDLLEFFQSLSFFPLSFFLGRPKKKPG